MEFDRFRHQEIPKLYADASFVGTRFGAYFLRRAYVLRSILLDSTIQPNRFRAQEEQYFSHIRALKHTYIRASKHGTSVFRSINRTCNEAHRAVFSSILIRSFSCFETHFSSVTYRFHRLFYGLTYVFKPILKQIIHGNLNDVEFLNSYKKGA